MAFETLDFKCAVITGASGGIGKKMAEWFSSQGKKVILVGRTEETLQKTSQELKNAPYYILDTGKIQDIPAFVKRVTSDHPEVDCLINNAGVQRPLEVAKLEPEEFLEKADQEISINITGPMHLALLFLPHFKKQSGAVIMNISSVLGYNPVSIINPVYNGSKAWVHFWSMNLRTQLKQSGHENIKVIEVAPPTVSTELHRERQDPHDNSKEKNSTALSVDEFMSEVVQGWKTGKETISAGPGVKIVERWFNEFGPDYAKAAGY